jgi:hypothetical protein
VAGIIGAGRVTAEGIYGSLAIAVVCLAWEGDRLGELALEVTVFAVSLWLFQVYARVVHAGWGQRNLSAVARWARREWPHLEAAIPALLALLIGWLAGWDPIQTSDVALAATLLNLFAWQVTLLRSDRQSPTIMVGTLVLDFVVVVALLALRLWIK